MNMADTRTLLAEIAAIDNREVTPEVVAAWNAVLEFSQSVTLVGGWGGVFNASAQSIEVTNEAYNGQLAPGASISFGLQGGHSGNFAAPSCRMR